MLGASTLERLVADADAQELGLVTAVLPGAAPADAALQLERTASVSRAVRILPEGTVPAGDDLDDALHHVAGHRWVDGEELDVRQWVPDVTRETAPGTAPSRALRRPPATRGDWKDEAIRLREDVRTAREAARRWKADALRWKAEVKDRAREVKRLDAEV